MSYTPLRMHSGKAFNRVGWSQIQSYCGDLTPKFVTKQMGLRNLRIGWHGDSNPLPEDDPFEPWEFGWTVPLAEAIEASDLPTTFEEFVQKLGRITPQPSGRAVFVPEKPNLGQASGFIHVNGLIRHPDPVITLGMGIPILMTIQEGGSINNADAIDMIQQMVAAGINEQISDDYYAKLRRSRRWPARFMHEAYHTTEVIDRAF